LTQRFSGTSRRPSMELIFGRTKLVIQFMAELLSFAGR
jgi:hypothetical protein